MTLDTEYKITKFTFVIAHMPIKLPRLFLVLKQSFEGTITERDFSKNISKKPEVFNMAVSAVLLNLDMKSMFIKFLMTQQIFHHLLKLL